MLPLLKSGLAHGMVAIVHTIGWNSFFSGKKLQMSQTANVWGMCMYFTKWSMLGKIYFYYKNSKMAQCWHFYPAKIDFFSSKFSFGIFILGPSKIETSRFHLGKMNWFNPSCNSIKSRSELFFFPVHQNLSKSVWKNVRAFFFFNFLKVSTN